VFLLNILSPLQRREGLGFALEPRQTFAISGNRVGQDLDGNVAPRLRVARAVDLAPPAPSGAKNFTRAEA
jgi:hypothetical protein